MTSPTFFSRAGRAVAWLLVLCPIAAFAAFVWKFSVNSPFWDDYDSVLNMVMMLHDATTVRGFIDTLVMQHNEHRIVFVKLVSYLYAKAFGAVNFKAIVVLGSLQLLALFVLLGRTLEQPLEASTLWPVSVLLFQPSYHEAALWVTASWSNITVIVFAFASLYLLLGKRQHLWGAIVLAVLATYSQANGIFTFIAGAAGLLAQRRHRELGVWLAVAAVVGVAFFHDYTRPSYHPPIDLSPEGIWQSAQFFVAFVGNIGKTNGAAFILGGLMIGAFLAMGRYWWRYRPMQGSFALFLMLTAASASLARSPFGIESAFGSRYTLVSTVLLAIISLAFVSRFPGRRAVLGFGAVSIILAFVHWDREGNQSDFTQKLVAQSKVGELCYQDLVYPPIFQAIGVETLKRAEMYGIFRLPLLDKAGEHATLICRNHFDLAVRVVPTTLTAGFARETGGSVESVEHTGKMIQVSGWAPIGNQQSGLLHIAVPLTPITYEVKSEARPDIAKKLGDDALQNSGFRITLTFPTPEQAQESARYVCVGLTTATDREPMALASKNPSCRRFMKH